ncbi:MAG: hypothetical protein KF799_13060 [Bdellovibrionales bacterium]|nr:hypothetical protein [Bdellovibrionales bacterium]
MSDQPIPFRLHIGKNEFTLPNPVRKRLTVDGVHLVMVDYANLATHDLRRNVFAFDSDGNFIWRVQAAPYIGPESNSWTYFRVAGNQVHLGTARSDSNEVILDIKTGRIFFEDGSPVPEQPDRV